MKAEHEGFTPAEVRDVALNVNDQVAIRIHMKVGTVSQTVDIVDGASLISESPAVATVVDRQFVENLPLNGRSFQSLISLTPGVVLTKSTIDNQGQFSVNGQRANSNYFHYRRRRHQHRFKPRINFGTVDRRHTAGFFDDRRYEQFGLHRRATGI